LVLLAAPLKESAFSSEDANRTEPHQFINRHDRLVVKLEQVRYAVAPASTEGMVDNQPTLTS
jgi:hypothetical protein